MLEFELVLPAYNEAKGLQNLIARAAEAARAANLTAERFKLVVVDNGSTDDTAAVLKKLESGELGPWFRTVSVMPNQGYGNGIWQGLKTTTAPVVAWSHADLQCDPKDALAAFKTVSAAS